MSAVEINFDGLVGPTHHYAGLAEGNLASATHSGQVANPKAAALQGIGKMRFMLELGLTQGLIPPQLRPNLALLHQFGFRGTDAQVLNQAMRQAPKLLSAAYSASYMWTANAATVSPSFDTEDGKTHFTAANLTSHIHRAQEASAQSQMLKTLFHDPKFFHHHAPLPASSLSSDEGAANHNRLCPSHGSPGFEVFVYGRKGFMKAQQQPHPALHPARQTLEASQAIARLHQLSESRCLFVQQNPKAIDAGVFHNDVISVANENVFFIHEEAFVEQKAFYEALCTAANFDIELIEVPSSKVSLEDAVHSYLFNSQLLTLPDSSMILVAPSECQEIAPVHRYLEELVTLGTRIKRVAYLDVKQSMQNGGGPACLRLRVALPKAALTGIAPGVIMDFFKLTELEAVVHRQYPDRIQFAELGSLEFLHQAQDAHQALANLLLG